MLWHSYSLPPHYGSDLTQADCLYPDGKKKIWCRDSVTGIGHVWTSYGLEKKNANILISDTCPAWTHNQINARGVTMEYSIHWLTCRELPFPGIWPSAYYPAPLFRVFPTKRLGRIIASTSSFRSRLLIFIITCISLGVGSVVISGSTKFQNLAPWSSIVWR